MGKTFDQLLQDHSPQEMLNSELAHPAKALLSYLVLEPITHQGVTRVSVSARDERMQTLWGTMASEGLMGPGEPTPVAFYSALRSLVREFLQNPKPRHEVTDDPYASIERCIADIQKLLDVAKKRTVGVKVKKTQTHARAAAVADAAWDCLRQLSHSLGAIGIKAGEIEEEAVD
jgi:hypothetical protein